MKNLFFLLLLIFASCSTELHSQSMHYSTKSKKAIKLFEEAQAYPRAHLTKDMHTDYKGALELLDKAIAIDPNFWEANMQAGEFAEYDNQKQRAIDYYKRALAINPNITPTGSTYYFLANLQFDLGQYKDGQESIDIFLKKNNRQTLNPKIYNKALQLKESLDFAVKMTAHPYEFDPKNLGPGVNTKDPEYFPTLTVDGKTLLFTRRIIDKRIPHSAVMPKELDQRQEDFYVSTKDENGVFQKAIPMPLNINTINNEGAPTLGPDGRTLVFVACPDASGQNYGKGRYGRGSCDFFITKKLGSKWTNPENLPGKANTSAWESQPSLSSDGKTMYFIRRVRTKDGRPDTDIFVTYLQDDGTWSTAKRLPDNVNTPEAEESVQIHPDGKTLYFASRGHEGMGGSDLFVTRLKPDGTWMNPVNLGYPINTSADENSLLVDAQGDIAYFASDREGGYGDLDIYSFVMPESMRPTRTTYFEGLVFDMNTNHPIKGKFHLYDLKTHQEIIRSEADPITGEFMVTLPEGASYALSVEADGYLNFSKNFDMKLEQGQDYFRMNIPMVPITASNPVVLENIFFDFNKSDLLPESQVELDKLYEFLVKNPKIRIEISGHTDSRGDAALNQKLSLDRANAVVNYLVAKGIDKNRLVAKGYGATRPVVPQAEIDQMKTDAEKEAAHQRNRRTEYKIIP